MSPTFSPIELRLSQTHGPYLIASDEAVDHLDALLDEADFSCTLCLPGELDFVPPTLFAVTFGDSAREDIAELLRAKGMVVNCVEPDPLTYPPPVADLFEIDAEWDWSLAPQDWELPVPGLTSEHAEELLRVATNFDLRVGQPKEATVWAPWHAWRTLAMLQIESALEPLAQHLDHLDWAKDEGEEDLGMEELAALFGAFGPVALPTLEKRLANPALREEIRTSAIECIVAIARNPAHGFASVVPLFQRVLADFEQNPGAVNGFLISALCDARAEECLPLIEAAFAADCVDEMIVGDWEDVQIEFGLLSQRTHPRRRNRLHPVEDAIHTINEPFPSPKATKIGRNDPCPCGSGKKFKKCCG